MYLLISADYQSSTLPGRVALHRSGWPPQIWYYFGLIDLLATDPPQRWAGCSVSCYQSTLLVFGLDRIGFNGEGDTLLIAIIKHSRDVNIS